MSAGPGLPIAEVVDFEGWRDLVRSLIARQLPPEHISLQPPASSPLLPLDAEADFDPSLQPQSGTSAPAEPSTLRVPREFLTMAETVGYHTHPQRWNALYRLVWRIAHGERELLERFTDPDVWQCRRWEKEVRRDCHKMKAFVRFRRVADSDHEQYVAWHQPDHRIVRCVAPFFSRRFAGMRWTIFTPHESAAWDGQSLQFGPGVPRRETPSADELEALWRTYYGSTFNPARIKLAMMKSEMPVRFWPTLPETDIISQLLAAAPQRVEQMLAHSQQLNRSAADYLPEHRDLASLRNAAAKCRGCELCQAATQTVFGEGPPRARLMIVGEQPGDAEDRAGRPFVGPAGQLLDEALQAAGLNRLEIYLTNAVKHFNFQPRGKQRLHKKPPARAVTACRPWLLAEAAQLRPAAVVCLGVTALQAVAGYQSRLAELRGQWLESELCPHTLASWHPAAILRAAPSRASELRQQLIDDLRHAADLLLNT